MSVIAPPVRDMNGQLPPSAAVYSDRHDPNDPAILGMKEDLSTKLVAAGGTCRLDRFTKENSVSLGQLIAMGFYIWRREMNNKRYVSLEKPPPEEVSTGKGWKGDKGKGKGWKGDGGFDGWGMGGMGGKFGCKGGCGKMGIGKNEIVALVVDAVTALTNPWCQQCSVGYCWNHGVGLGFEGGKGDGGYGPMKGGFGKGGKKGGKGAPYSAPLLAQMDHVMAASKDDVDMFLAQHTVEPHASEYLQKVDPKIQMLVITKGHMLDAKNQTGVLISRINGLLQMQPNDWICPGCFDHQFSSNAVCRKCGSAKPA